MRNILKTLLILCCLVYSKSISAQEKAKTLYFLADTINVEKGSRAFEMGEEGVWTYFNFYCRCIANSDRDITFLYNTETSAKSSYINKPPFTYVSWKELSKLIWLEGKKFDKKYTLNIVEVLPNKRFRVNPVMLFIAETKY